MNHKILIEFGDYSFDQALDEIKNSLATEKDRAKRLTLLSAKSWIIRNKVYAMMHEPFVYSLNELENTNIFSDFEADDSSGLNGLFDDDDDEDDVRQKNRDAWQLFMRSGFAALLLYFVFLSFF